MKKSGSHKKSHGSEFRLSNLRLFFPSVTLQYWCDALGRQDREKDLENSDAPKGAIFDSRPPQSSADFFLAATSLFLSPKSGCVALRPPSGV